VAQQCVWPSTGRAHAHTPTHIHANTHARARTPIDIQAARSRRSSVRHVMCEHQSGRRLFVLAGYAWGPSNSTKCPSTYFRIATEDACEAAAVANGKTYAGPTSTPQPDRPKGCYWNEQGGSSVFFNTDPVGSAFPRRLPLCIGAPLRRQSRVLRRSARTSEANAAARAVMYSRSSAVPPCVAFQVYFLSFVLW